MNDSIKARLDALGLALPATEGESYYGAAYGTMKPFHITGAVLHLIGPCAGPQRRAPAPGAPRRDGIH